MELFETKDHFIVQDGEHSLWCSREDGTLEARSGHELCAAWNPVCLGQVHGVIGKIKIHPDGDWRLVLIRQHTLIGQLVDDAPVYRINKISVLPLSKKELGDLDIELCRKHHFGIRKPDQIVSVVNAQKKTFQKTWNTIKSAAENVKTKRGDMKDKDKFEKRILDELHRMFNFTESFYYSRQADLTNSLQRQNSPNYDSSLPLWKRIDDRFFWNKHMLNDVLNNSDRADKLADHWLVPVIQGYVQIENCTLDLYEDSSRSMDDLFDMKYKRHPTYFSVSVISRRSRHRAGTRYKRRGVDEKGMCANYVETEQIIRHEHHTVSFVQVRGSVPVYWSQTGYKYRPPPKLDKGSEETKVAFEKHFAQQIDIYRHVAIVNLVEQGGKEKVIADAFLNHILDYNSESLSYITFDFHEYCRGMKFENVSVLTESIQDIIKDMRYCWVDRKGMICEQRGVFRVNCIDCLDRTNVVQTALARIILEVQMRKLGLLTPDDVLPASCCRIYQQIWANNGDAISRQYAGTAALKGDYTRTGERKLTGMMNDGVRSANRYFLNRFKDAYRQTTIDIMLGNSLTEDLSLLSSTKEVVADEDEQTYLVEKEESMKLLMEECRKMLIDEPEQCLGSWALIDCDPSTADPHQTDMDTILLLTQRAFYVAQYDDDSENIVSYQKILLEELEKIEIGPEPSLFKSKHMCVRLWYLHDDATGYFYTLRTTNTRLFNNMVIVIKNTEEAKESLTAISESFLAALKFISVSLPVIYTKLERKRTKPHPHVIPIASAEMTAATLPRSLTRDISANHIQAEATKKAMAIGNAMNNMKKSLASFAAPIKKVRLHTRLKTHLKMPGIAWHRGQLQSSGNSDNVEVGEEPTEGVIEGIHNDGFDSHDESDTSSESIDSLARDLGSSASGSQESLGLPRDLDINLELNKSTSKDNDLVLQSCGILSTSPLVQSSLESEIQALRQTPHNLKDVSSKYFVSVDSEVPMRPTTVSKAFDRSTNETNTLSSKQDNEQSTSGDKSTISPRQAVGEASVDNKMSALGVVQAPESSVGEDGVQADKISINSDITGNMHNQALLTPDADSNQIPMSLSDGSFPRHAQDAPATREVAISNTSPFSKLKERINVLGLPNFASSASPKPQEKMDESSAASSFNNHVRAKLKFRQCKTRIIQL